MPTKALRDVRYFLAPFRWLHWSLFPVVVAIFGHAALGVRFYKWQLYGIFATEWLLIMGSFCLGVYWIIKGSLPRIRLIPWLLALTAAYLAWSLLLDRDLYWVLRHGSLLLYMSVAIWGWLYARWESQFHTGFDKRLFWTFAIVGLITYLAHLGVKVGEQELLLIRTGGTGHGQFAAYNIMIVGLGYWILTAPSAAGRLVWGILIAYIFYLMGVIVDETAARQFTPFIFLPVTLFLVYPRLRLFLLLVTILAVPAVLFAVKGFTDPNAFWRYQFWSALIRESMYFSFGGLGQGFGMPHAPSEVISTLYPTLGFMPNALGQPFEYEALSVAPHNGVLLLLKQLGLPGVVLFLLPVYHGLKRIGFRCVDDKLAPWLMAMAGLFPAVLSFPVLTAPYVAVFFFWCYGVFVYQVYRP